MSFTLLRPSTPEEAVNALSDGAGSLAVAGGTDALLDLEDGKLTATRLVVLSRMPWKTLRRSPTELSIGSTLPLRDLERDPAIPEQLPGLYEAVHAVGSVALRHRATLGGNLGRASPSSDLIPILLALEGRVRLVGPGTSREETVERFVRGPRSVDLRPGELIESVSVPLSAPSSYIWQRVRPANDISQVGVAVAFLRGPAAWRIALGGVVPKSIRLPGAEELLTSATPDRPEILAAAELAARNAPFATDRRASEGYRRLVVRVLVRRAVERVVRSTLAKLDRGVGGTE